MLHAGMHVRTFSSSSGGTFYTPICQESGGRTKGVGLGRTGMRHPIRKQETHVPACFLNAKGQELTSDLPCRMHRSTPDADALNA